MPLQKFVCRSVIHGLEPRDKKAQLAAVAAGKKPHSVHRPGDIVELDGDDPAVKEMVRPGVLELVDSAQNGVRDPNAEAQGDAIGRTDAIDKNLTAKGEGFEPSAATPGVALPEGAKLPGNNSPSDAKPKA